VLCESTFSFLVCGCRLSMQSYLPPAALVRAGDLTMVLDFGSFALDSDADAAADLPAEEAALYMGFKLSARNISSFLVDGNFTWALLKSLSSPGRKQNGAQGAKSGKADAISMNHSTVCQCDSQGSTACRQSYAMGVAFLLTLLVIVAPGMAAEDGTLVVPLLERCAIESALHLAKFSHPSLPPLRLALTLPSLHFHLSPGRLHRVMRVLDGALPRASLL